MGRLLEKAIRFVNHIFLAFLDQSLFNTEYIGNILRVYRTNCALSRTKIQAQNTVSRTKSFLVKRLATPRMVKHDFVIHVFELFRP